MASLQVPPPSPKQIPKTNPPPSPIKLKLAIRDHFTLPTSPLQTTLHSLTTLLGLPILLTPEWPLLLTSLSPLYPPSDSTLLVLSLAGTIQTFARSLAELLDDPLHDAWTETVLERINGGGAGGLRVFLDVAGDGEVGVRWSEGVGRVGFVVTVPGRERVVRPEELAPRFRGMLEGCFEEGEGEGVVPLAVRGGGGDDWADVEVDTATGRVDVVEKTAVTMGGTSSTSAKAPVVVEFLPNVQSLPRPDELFLRAPYYLTVSAGHDGVEIHGSHSPSLKVIAEYFKKWCRVNHHDSTAVRTIPRRVLLRSC